MTAASFQGVFQQEASHNCIMHHRLDARLASLSAARCAGAAISRLFVACSELSSVNPGRASRGILVWE